MKCDKVDFHYRGHDSRAGRHLAELLSDMTLFYEYGEGSGKTKVGLDLGSLLRELVLKVIEPASRQTNVRPTLDDLNRENGVSVVTAVPPVYVRALEVRQWLQSMNIPMGVPVTVQFVDDISRDNLVKDDQSFRDPHAFDKNPDATEKKRRGW
jgi:hypothetical protein